MRVSKRLAQIPPYLFAEIDKKVAEAKAKGLDIINLGIGDPDTPTPDSIVAEMHQSIDDPQTHNYPPYDGTVDFKKTAAEWMKKRFDVDVNPDKEILALIGSKEGIAHVFLGFVDPGDYTLVPDPAYPVYRNATYLTGGIPYLMPINPENKYLPELDKIPEEVAKKAKLIFLNYPNNPTGAVANIEYFKEVLDFAKKYDLLICHDQAYSEVTFDGYVAPSFLQLDGAKERTIEFFSHSKTYNMTGWRVGFAVGGAEPMKALGVIKNNIDSGIFKAIQRAGITALNSSTEQLDKLNLMYQNRRDVMVEGLKELGWDIEPSKATFYLWLPTPPNMNSVDFAALMLEKANLIVPPGNGYGPGGEGFFRIALTVPEEKLREAIKRMKDAGIRYN